jgi:hypothetical protein
MNVYHFSAALSGIYIGKVYGVLCLTRPTRMMQHVTWHKMAKASEATVALMCGFAVQFSRVNTT